MKKINLHFYQKLFESNPTFDQGVSSEVKEPYYNKIRDLFTALYLIFKCFFLKKNKTLFFNHTQRVRKNSPLVRSSLYLNKAIFNKTDFYYIDQNIKKISHYNGPKAILDIATIDRLVSILLIPERIFNKFKNKKKQKSELFFYYSFYVWLFILKRLKPKKIIMIVWYAYQPIICAAKELSIPVIDLQHGIIYSEHEFYNLKKNNLIDSNNTLPDECWVYGNYWKEQLIKAGWNENKIKVFGYYLNLPQKEKVDTLFPYILYTTSCTENKKEVLNHINSIIHEVKRRGLKIIIAPHPHENLNNYKDMLSDIVMLSDKDSYDLLKSCEVHISAFSTLLWEGLYFGKPTYILAYDIYKDHFSILTDLIKNNIAKKITENEFPEIYESKNNIKIQDYFCLPKKELLH